MVNIYQQKTFPQNMTTRLGPIRGTQEEDTFLTGTSRKRFQKDVGQWSIVGDK